MKIQVLKEGQIIETREFQDKVTFGRLQDNDFILLHSSISRTHAVLEKVENNFYLMDLESVHGTFLNKIRIPSRKYFQVYSGDFIVFGQSSRKYIVEDIPERTDKAHSKVGKVNVDQEDVAEISLLGKVIPVHVWKKNPKVILSNWFDQQGYELKVEVVQDQDSAEVIGRIRMPVELVNMVVQVTGDSQKMKELEGQVCLEACRRLYERGLLVDTEAQMTEKEKRKMRNEMFGDSDNDDDLIYDKTIKKKKTRENKPETFVSLSEKRLKLMTELEEITNSLKEQESQVNKEDEQDSLDAFMSNIQSKNLEKTRANLEKRLPELKLELEKTDKLLEIVRPSALVSNSRNQVSETSSAFKVPMPMKKSPQKPVPIEQTIILEKLPKQEIQDEDHEIAEKKQVRQYGAMTLDESAKHYSIETEEVEVAPDLDYGKKNEIIDQNAAYGY